MSRSVGLSDQIRDVAKSKYISPAVRAGKREFSISVRDLMDAAEAKGIPTAKKVPAFCTSIVKKGFLRENHLQIVSIDGPASKRSTTVVVHYRWSDGMAGQRQQLPASGETPKERAHRLVEKMRGLMKDEIAAHGGAEGFLRWVRSDEDEA